MLRCHGATAVAIASFRDGKHTFYKTRRAREHFANANDFDNVYANGDDHGRYGTNRLRLLLART